MATRNKNRYRRIRAGILSASVLSFLPLLSLIQSGNDPGVSAAAVPADTAASEVSAIASVDRDGRGRHNRCYRCDQHHDCEHNGFDNQHLGDQEHHSHPEHGNERQDSGLLRWTSPNRPIPAAASRAFSPTRCRNGVDKLLVSILLLTILVLHRVWRSPLTSGRDPAARIASRDRKSVV